MEGSTRTVIDPISSAISNTHNLLKRAETNKAKCLLMNLTRCGGLGEVIEVDENDNYSDIDPISGELLEEVDNNKPDDKTAITVIENGKKKYLVTDPAIVKAVNNMSTTQVTAFAKIMRIGTNFVKMFATTHNPAFAFRNIARDYQDAFLYSKYGFFSPLDFAEGLMHAIRQDKVFYQWRVSGGAQASFWSVDRNYERETLEKLTKGKYARWASAKGLWNLLSVIGSYSEAGTRIGYFNKIMKAKAKQHGDSDIYGDLVTAAFESRDLMDYARGGKSSRQYNNYAAFGNAKIQGWNKFYRTYNPRQAFSKDPEIRKQFWFAVGKLIIGAGVLTAFLFSLNHDKDWYKEDLQDYEKQNYWIVGENLRIPKGFDFGLRFFSNLVEEILNYQYNKDPKAFENMWQPFYDELPELLPTAAQPLFECIANYDFFRKKNIDPAYEVQSSNPKPPYLRYDQKTSELAKFLGEQANLSPRRIDHFIFGFTGNLGRETMRTIDAATGAKDYNFKMPNDIPLFGGFFRMPYRNPKILTDYYKIVEKQNEMHNAFELTGEKPENFDLKFYKKVESNQKIMKKLAKKEREIIANPKLSGEEKDNQQREVQKKRIEIAKRILQAQ